MGGLGPLAVLSARGGLSAALFRTGKVLVAVHHFGNSAEAERLAGAIGAAAPEVEVLICPLPAVLAAHVGLGVLAVAVASESGPTTTGTAE